MLTLLWAEDTAVLNYLMMIEPLDQQSTVVFAVSTEEIDLRLLPVLISV